MSDKVVDQYKCKICGGKIVATCKCSRRDSICENDCKYHWSPFHQEFHFGSSDHATDTMGPKCCVKKEVIGEKNDV
ncbi:hypothetical protein D3C76_396760 [compost metagenome]